MMALSHGNCTGSSAMRFVGLTRKKIAPETQSISDISDSFLIFHIQMDSWQQSRISISRSPLRPPGLFVGWNSSWWKKDDAIR
jgi:hypothetical protein